MHRHSPIACALAAGFALAPAAWAAAESEAGAGADFAPRLTRQQAVQRGVAQSLGLLAQRLELRRARLSARAAWQAYSPTLVIDAEYRKAEADAFGREQLLEYAAGVSLLTPIGTALSARVQAGVGISGLASEDGSRSGRATDGEVSLGLLQPLLRGGWLEGAALPLREAALAEQLQRELFRDELNALVAAVDAAYWDLAVAEADQAIKERSRDRARQQYEDTAENIRRGILAPGEIYVVEENVVFFEQELVRAEQTLRLARRRLAELLRLPADLPLSAADALEGSELAVPAREQAVDEGQRQSPRIAAQGLRLALASERVAGAHNQALPSLDLSASLSLDGSDEAYAEAWRKVFGEPRLEGRVGLVLGVPLDRAAVRASVDGAELEARRQQALLEGVRLEVRFDVDNALADLESSVRLLALSQKSVQLAELKLGAETDKYKSGLATLADLVRFQRDLDNALIGLQRLHRAVRVGRARLLASQGTLHRALGVDVR